ncbi:hypothetical protein D9756_006998 [Leucocoprinus leucothites]|uniref:Hemerythrin-like domain-containing protein n=1 Tax=Leucocoprinus leucothites TaxID=201217 RepID=A0A8H5D613_9AGAR|nr:hypothetical protein D9756_006998 [Leucoagaricus leucothites]
MATVKGFTLKEAIKDDHDEMYLYFDEYKKNKGNAEAQARWSRLFTWEIARHAVGEEIVVYPLMEKHLGSKGKKLADGDRSDHQYVKERLYELEGLTPGTEEHALKMQDIVDHLKPHNESEENEDLPLLEAAIGSDESKRAAQSFKNTKKFVPTRAHPGAPNQPPYETLAGFLQAPIDKLKDYFSTFPSAEEKQEAKQGLN